MSHMLEFTNGKANMAWAGETPWHGLGTRVPADLTPAQIQEAAGLDWDVSKVPAFATIGGKKVDIGHSALVRSSDNRVLDVVTNDWEPLNNDAAFEFFNEFIEAGSMEMHTAGSLKGGRIVWALAKTKDSFTLFNGDTVESYLLFTNPHQFGKSIDIRFTNTRVVCNNTLTLANSESAKTSARVTHRQEFDPEAVKETMGLAHQNLETYRDAAMFLGSKQYKQEDVVEYFKRIFPVLSNKEESQKKISKNAQMAIDLVEQQPGAEFAPGTFWNLFNATTFMTNHVLGRNPDNRVQSLFYGQGKNLNIKALKEAVDMAEAA